MDHLGGLDHVVILANDLDGACASWRHLGFTLSPRGTHSAHKGTGNYTIMLAEDYIELLGVLTETDLNAADRAALVEHGEGLDRAAFRTDDAKAGVAALKAREIAVRGPQAFGRPVDLPGGGTTEASFRTFEWADDATPGGLRLFACEHQTPEAVWVPELMRHPNTARAIARLEILSGAPEEDAAEMARLIGQQAESCPDGAWRVPSGPGRADLVFLDTSLLADRHPGIPVVECRASGAAALVLAVEDLAAARRAVPDAVQTGETTIAVPPATTNGVLLAFESP